MNSEKFDNPLLPKNSEAGPKLSIGMPVYNGGRLLRRALDSLLAQTFTDFELIISDNASTDNTERICEEYAKKDSRLRYIRQTINRGVRYNFNFVLKQAIAKFFMWAAHDDYWDTCFLGKIMREFSLADHSVVAIGSEAQYTINTEKQAFFPEGRPFYHTTYSLSFDRVKHILKNNYGNMFYSIYRISSLYMDNKSVLSIINQNSLNEIPFFILVATKGNWLIIPEILFFKETNKATYQKAKWEMTGGRFPYVSFKNYSSGLIYSLFYHLITMHDIFKSIGFLDMPASKQFKLRVMAMWYLWKHYFSHLSLRKAITH